MKCRIPVFLIIGVFLLNACKDPDTVFEEFQSLDENLLWARNSAHSFDIPIRDNSHPLEMAVAFRCAASYPYSDLLLRITETSPEGVTTIRDVDIPVRKEGGEVLGDISGDLADLVYTIDTGKKYPVLGTYHYKVEHTMPMDTVHLALEIGLIVRRRPEGN